MSKTKTQTKRSIPAVTGGNKQRPARKAAPPAAMTPPAGQIRSKGRPAAPAAVISAAVPTSQRPSKQATIAALLRRPEGAAITELMTVTGWQQHSVRAALTGLRKQGFALLREPGPKGGSIYRITHTTGQTKA
jgi:hypothetical protein